MMFSPIDSVRPVSALGRMLGQTGEEPEGPCFGPVGEPGWRSQDGGPCIYDPDDPQPEGPPLGPGGQPLPPDFVAPGPTALHPERWDLDASPCTYTMAYGDTYVGITKTYLDPSGVRWREVWRPNKAQHPNPDMTQGGTIVMPEEACENMRRWLRNPKPGTLPSQTKPGIGDTARKWASVALIAATAAGLYWMS